MKKIFKFIGNENDSLTKEWGLKKGTMYKINFPAFPPKGKFVVFIETPCKGIVVCPYSSLSSFENNWE